MKNKKMPSKKQTSKKGPIEKNGKTLLQGAQLQPKSTVKYTIERTSEDIKNIDKIRKYLEINNFNNSYKSDSKIYRELPSLFLNAVKEKQDLQLAIDELTAKLDQLEDLQSCFCRIFKLCEMKE